MDISIKEINLKERYKSIHRAEIAKINSFENENAVLLNIWHTEEYKSVSQQIIVFNKFNIVEKYKLPKNLRWNYAYKLTNETYLLGSIFSSVHSGAVLALFNGNAIVMSKVFDKGSFTEICTIQRDIDNTVLIRGNWYKCVPCGGHDDYMPELWQSRITIGSSDFIDEDLDESYQSAIKLSIPDTDLNPENYYVLEDFGISKYSNDDKLIWNQGLGHLGNEGLQPLNKMAPFFKTQNGQTIQDGVWFSGADHTHSDRSLSEPLFGRVTAGGTIQSFKHILYSFPEIYKIHTLISGMDNNCLMIAETLIMGQGNGLCLLYNHFTAGVWQQQIKYINFIETDLRLIIQDKPEFYNTYLDIKKICPQSERLEDLKEIIIFGNVSHLRNRDNGNVWTINLSDSFNVS